MTKITLKLYVSLYLEVKIKMKLLKKIQEMGIFSKITLLTTCVIVLLSTLSTAFLLQQFSGNLKEKDHLLVREAAEKIYD